MNQEKIGKFIAYNRKKKNLTQEQLAEKLGVTDRSISNWENGKNMPDLSLFKPLCEELEITINELLSGEKVNLEDYQEKLEENILNTIDYADKKIKKTNKILKIVIVIPIILLITLAVMFFIDVRRMKENKPVVFSTWGFKYSPAITLNEGEIYQAIKNYLVLKGDNETIHHEGTKTFVGMRVYLLEEKIQDEKYYVYAWVRDSKYYLEDDELKEDSASSIPYKFIVEKSNNEYYVTDSRIPRDGSYYADDMKNIFPQSVRNDMNDVYIDGTIEKLDLEIKEKVKLYFHK